MKYFNLTLVTIFLLGSSAFSQDDNSDEKKFSFFKEKQTEIVNPFELRDPFKRKVQKRGKITKNVGVNPYFNGEKYTNKPTLENVLVEQIRVIGVLLGPNRRAMVKLQSIQADGKVSAQMGLNQETFIIKEGMKLGQYGAEVKAILPGGIVLVEKIRNVYDQDEFLETIIPVSE